LNVFIFSWDDEMDGEWEPPQIDNPEYKGEWKPKQIDNPAYKGTWKHPEIDNPEYAADNQLYLRDEFCTVGLDLWQVKSGTIFDNFLVTDDIEYATKLATASKATQEGEKKMKDAQDEEERKKSEAENPPEDKEDDEDDDDNEIPEKVGEVEEAEHDEL
jgi:calreticulin